MNDIILIAKWIIIIEILVIISFVAIAYILKAYYSMTDKTKNKQAIRLNDMLTSAAQSGEKFSNQQINFLQKIYNELLITICKFDAEHKNISSWKAPREQLFSTVIKPKVAQLTASRKMIDHYLATECIYHSNDAYDEALIARFLRDPILLISANAERVVFKHPTSASVNSVIDSLAKSDHYQQSIYTYIVPENASIIVPIITQRLLTEQKSHIKIFCYHMLTEYPVHGEMASCALQDVESADINLKLAVLGYLTHYQQEKSATTLQRLLSDSHWEVRTRAILLLGKLKYIAAATAIGEKLKDPEWWVRFRAAETLGQFGNEGIAILKAQNPTADKYAYDVANQVLLSLKNNKH